MKLKEQVNQDKQTLKQLNPQQKCLFIWDYYKLPILCILLVLILAVTGITLAASSGKTALYAVLVNANNEAAADPFTPLLEKGGKDMRTQKVSVEASYTLHYENPTDMDATTLQVLAALFGIGDLDVFAADEAVYASYAKQNAFVDLRLFISADILKAHQSDLYYSEAEDGTPIVSGLWLREGSFLHEAGYYSADVIIGVATQAQNFDDAVLAIQQIWQ